MLYGFRARWHFVRSDAVARAIFALPALASIFWLYPQFGWFVMLMLGLCLLKGAANLGLPDLSLTSCSPATRAVYCREESQQRVFTCTGWNYLDKCMYVEASSL